MGKAVTSLLENTSFNIYPLSRRDGLDLLDYDCTKKYFSEINPDVVINCAAHVGSLHYVNEFSGDIIYNNMQISLNTYRAIKETSEKIKVINPLSNCSYPGEANIQYEAEWWNGEVHESVFSYGNAKRFIYVVSKNFLKQYGIETINFIVPNTFGPGDYTDPSKTHALNGMIIRMILAKKKKKSSFEIWGTGSPIREWAYINDVAEILIKGIFLENIISHPINIAQNKGFSIKESAELISEAVGFKGKLMFNTKYQDGAAIKVLDDNIFRSFFPEYKFFDHFKGIKETVNYYRTLI